MDALHIILVTCLVLAARGAEICCPDVGCFSDDPPFSHFPLPNCPEELDIRMVLFTAEDRQGTQINRQNVPNIGSEQRVAFLVHGFNGDGSYFFARMRDALLNRGEFVVTVNWNSTNVFYPIPASNTRAVGREIGLMARRMVEQGADRLNTWCIGHSLGGQTCGFAGKFYKLGRITGSDPAGPAFEGFSSAAHLFRTDADFVDVLHTDAGGAGFYAAIGDADFYPNGGVRMAGCTDNSCDHRIVSDYLIESMALSCPFTATQECRDAFDIPGSCNVCRGGVCQYMGYSSDTHPGRGIFYLTTNPQQPFCQQ